MGFLSGVCLHNTITTITLVICGWIVLWIGFKRRAQHGLRIQEVHCEMTHTKVTGAVIRTEGASNSVPCLQHESGEGIGLGEKSPTCLLYLSLLCTKSRRQPNRNPNTRHEKPSFKLLVRTTQESLKECSLMLLSLVTPPEVKSRFLLLKIPYTPEAGPRDF